MAKIYVWTETFTSVSVFVDSIKKRQPNTAFAYESLSSEKRGSSFSGTYCMEDANKLLVGGYPEGLNKMLSCKGGIKINTGRKETRVVDFKGQRVHMSSFLADRPRTMVRRIVEPPKVSTLILTYDCTASGGVESETLARGGKNLMALIKYVESKNIRVELNMMMGTAVSRKDGGYDGRICKVKIKDAKQTLNPLLISYPITHPSFFRRHMFRWIETSPITDDSRFVGGYGWCLRNVTGNINHVMNELRKVKLIKDNEYYLDCESCADADSIDYLFNKMQLKIK